MSIQTEKGTWVVIANPLTARVAACTRGFRHPHLLHAIAPRDPRSGETEHDEAQGNDAADPSEAERVSHEVGELLNAGWRDQQFNEVVLIAGSQFLGRLHDTVAGPMARAILAEVPLDLTEERLTDAVAQVRRRLVPEE